MYSNKEVTTLELIELIEEQHFADNEENRFRPNTKVNEVSLNGSTISFYPHYFLNGQGFD